MKNKTKLLLLASALAACAFAYQPRQHGMTASETLRTNAQYNRNLVSIFENYGLPVVAARFQGRAEAMEEIADLIDAGEIQTGAIQGPN